MMDGTAERTPVDTTREPASVDGAVFRVTRCTRDVAGAEVWETACVTGATTLETTPVAGAVTCDTVFTTGAVT